MNSIDAYARRVVAGHLPAGKYHRLACVRHERDRAHEGSRAFPYVFDLRRAERFWQFAEKLKHYKGEWAGQYIHLEPHQRFRLGSLFGWVHRTTGLRRFRSCYFEIPRKNGKSLEAAVVALYASFFDGEPGAEGYTVATKREQAKLVFNDCKRLVQSSGLRSRIVSLVANLHRDDTASKLEPLGADRDSTDGLNPQIVIIDEAHAMKHRGMIDVMETAVGARRQPVLFWITTAGTDLISPCGDQHAYACKVLDRVLIDESLFAFIAHADPEDDWLAPTTWQKANPNYGISVKLDDLRTLATKAAAMPPAAAAFKQKRLNLWVSVVAPWLSVDGWRKGQSNWSADEMLGQPCAIGIDMSSKIDLTALVVVFPPTAERRTWRIIPRCLTPADTLEARAHRDRAPYLQWVARGWLETCPGSRIDQSVIRTWVAEARARYDVQGIGIDPWNAGNLSKELEHDSGQEPIEIPQNISQMSGPSKDFEADVLEGLVDANGNELMQWCIANAVVYSDNKDNIYPIKKKSTGRIDPVIGALIARKVLTIEPEPHVQHQLMIFGGPTPAPAP
jgi:phage terminase large subunit-like protein